MRRVVLALSLLLSSSVWAADDQPRLKRTQELFGWSGSTIPDLTSAGTVTGTNVAFTDLVSCNTIDTDANGNFVCGVDGGGGGNSFETISVPAGTSPVADSATDTLTITETSFLTITGTAGTDTIDITQVTTDLGTDGLIAANAVALGTDTTGNYVATVADAGNTTITVAGSGAETAAVTLDAVDLNCTGCLSATELAADSVGSSEVIESQSYTVANLTATSTVTGAVVDISTFDIQLDAFTSCTALETTSTGNLKCGTDDTGAGGGDAITVNSSAATDPDFLNGDIDWTLTGGNSITATPECSGCINATDMAADSVGASEVIESESYTVANLTSTNTVTGTVLDLSTFDARNTAWGAGFLKTDSSGNIRPDTSTKEYWIPCPAALPLEAADSIPPLTKDAGTNLDQLACSYDDSTDEGRTAVFKVPASVASSGVVTFRAYWYSAAATSGAIIWDFRHNGGVADGVDPDQSLTTIAAASDTTAGTAGQLNITTWTSTLSALGWVANDLVYGVFERDANNAGDTLVGDAVTVGFSVEIPQS